MNWFRFFTNLAQGRKKEKKLLLYWAIISFLVLPLTFLVLQLFNY